MAKWSDGWWVSAEGLRLHYRDYPARAERAHLPPILCIPGLTRNVRDFAGIAERLAGAWRLICVELRGRGESAWAKDPASYAPPTYLQDLVVLLDALAVPRVVAFGTSLGGILTMLLALTSPGRLAGALLNDIGPDVEAAGFARIRSYVGKGGSWPTWLHAARIVRDTHADAFPKYDLADWIAMTKRLARLTPAGRVVMDYDMKIAEPMKAPAAVFDLWPAYHALDDLPLLLVRGALSDIVSVETFARMRRRHRGAEAIELERLGHAPTLDEPALQPAIDRLLARVEAEVRNVQVDAVTAPS